MEIDYMPKKHLTIVLFISMIFLMIWGPNVSEASTSKYVRFHQERTTNLKLIPENISFQRFVFDSGLHFEYPDAVRGIYVTGHSAGGSRFEQLIDLIENSDLNAMVIDIKDDWGNITFQVDEDSPYAEFAKNYISDPEQMMKVLEEKQIYPIARIVAFKDTVLAERRPDLSFTQNGEVWKNNRNEAFVNPFLKEVWDHNINIAKMAVELGFQDIQFDYVRFPEGFELRDEELVYDQGEYANSELNNIQRRVEAVTDFVKYARETLGQYGVDVSVDIFGYAATIPETPGIGQNFTKIAENVDVISSMIYPSHWTAHYFGIPFPDKEPYRLVTEYAKVENELLSKLDDPPISRPWIQDFEAPWLYNGPVMQYGKEEVEAQIKALNEQGIFEFLLWNAGNEYTRGVNYIP